LWRGRTEQTSGEVGDEKFQWGLEVEIYGKRGSKRATDERNFRYFKRFQELWWCQREVFEQVDNDDDDIVKEASTGLIWDTSFNKKPEKRWEKKN
jgi:hypothetical protein